MLKIVIKIIILFVLFNGSLIITNNVENMIDINNSALNFDSMNSSDMIATLVIPKINLNRHLYDVHSSRNNVNKNIKIINPSDMPDVKNGNLILAAHSGNSRIAFFKNLDKLKNGDMAIIIYNNKEYKYKLASVYSVQKNGKVEIIRKSKKTCLTLITCDKKDKNKQLVFIFELIEKNLS